MHKNGGDISYAMSASVKLRKRLVDLIAPSLTLEPN